VAELLELFVIVVVVFDVMLRHVQRLVDHLGDGCNSGSEFVFNSVKGGAIFHRYQIDGNSKMSKATRSSDSVQVRFGHLGKVEVDHNVNRLNVNTSRKQIGTDKIAAEAVAEVVENPISMRLGHLSVNVVARVAQLGYLFGQKFDTLRRVAEYN
jgi:hypothetical protein